MTNYYQEMIEVFAKLKEQGIRPKLLLHSCCAPCNCYPMELLVEYFDITLFYNNSNIYFPDEYNIRLDELRRFLDYFNSKHKIAIEMIVTPYQPNEFDSYLQPLKDEQEGGKRCYSCYQKRLSETEKYASENNFDYFGTVMTISRKKNAIFINEIGQNLENENVSFLVSDFKKKGGQEKGIAISKELNMYRQSFCGCKYSKKD